MKRHWQIKVELQNTVLNWTSVAPIRFFHGDANDFAPCQNAATTFNNLIANGESYISLIIFCGKNHEFASLPSVIGMIEWFETFRM